MFNLVKRWIVRVARAAPILMALTISLFSACEKDPIADTVIAVGGKVFDRETNEPIESVRVRLIYQWIDTIWTEVDGKFYVDRFGKEPWTNAVLLFNKDGFEPFDTVLAYVPRSIFDLRILIKTRY